MTQKCAFLQFVKKQTGKLFRFVQTTQKGIFYLIQCCVFYKEIIESLLVIIFLFDEKLDNYAPKRNYKGKLPLPIYACVSYFQSNVFSVCSYCFNEITFLAIEVE